MKEFRLTNKCKKVVSLALEKGIELTEQGFRLKLNKFQRNGKDSKLFVAFFLSKRYMLSIGK